MTLLPATDTGLTQNQADERYPQLLIDVSSSPAPNTIPRSDNEGLLNDWVDFAEFYTSAQIDTLLGGKSNTGHTHDDRYYTESEADSRYAALIHDHDGRYYTETEADGRFAGIVHDHDDRYYLKDDVDSLIAGIDLSGYYTKVETDDLLVGLMINVSENYAPISHTHDASEVVSGVLDNARVNWASPSNFGSTTPASLYANYLSVHVQDWAGGSELYGHSNTNFRGHSLTFFRSRGTQATPEASQAGDTLGYVSFAGHDGTNYGSTAVQIQAIANQLFEVGKRGSVLDFLVAGNDTASATTKMRILGSGKTIIGSNFSWNTARLNISHVSGETGLIIRSAANNAPHFQLQNSSGVTGVQSSNDAYGLEFLRNSRTPKHRYQVYYDDISGTLLYQSYNTYFSGTWQRDDSAKEGVLQFFGNYTTYGDRALIGWFNITGTAPTTTVVPVMSISSIEPGVRIGNFADNETNTAFGAQLYIRGRDTTLIPLRVRQSAGGSQEIVRIENSGGGGAYFAITPTASTFTHGVNATAFSADVTSNTAYLAYYLRNQDTGVNAAAQIVFGNNQGGNRMQLGIRGGNYTATANQAGVGYMGMGNETALVFYHGSTESLRLNRQVSTFRFESAHSTTAQAAFYWQARTTNTGSLGNGFGLGHMFQLRTSGTGAADDQNAAALDVSWATSDHATRVGQIIFNVYNVATKTPVLTLQSSRIYFGSSAYFDFNGSRVFSALNITFTSVNTPLALDAGTSGIILSAATVGSLGASGQSGFQVIHWSKSSSINAVLQHYRQVNHLKQYLRIAGADTNTSSNNGVAAGDVMIYGGVDSWGNGNGNLILNHDGTNKIGRIGLGTNSPAVDVDINADNIRIRTAKTPASASDTGVQGQIAWDSSYIYVAVATNTWKRAALATW